MKFKILFFAGLSLFALLIAPTRFVRAEPVSMNSQTVCLNPVRCDRPNSQCSSYGTNPLYTVHRVRLEVEGQLRTNEIYMQECIERINAGGTPGETICVPLPVYIQGSDWKVSNLFTNGSKSWINDKEYFTNAKKQECMASFTDSAIPTEVEATCAQIASDWETDVNEYLTANEYAFHGLFSYIGAAPSVLNASNAYTTYPTQYERGRIFEWGSSSRYANHYFIATTYTPPIEGTSGSDPSNKVGQLGFPAGTPECSFEDYDPFGQVFDRVTMQPVEGVKVALYRDVRVNVADPTNSNYILFNNFAVDKLIDLGVLDAQYTLPSSYQPSVSTNSMGYYNFVVPPGMYKVVVDRNLQNYSGSIEYPIPTLLIASSILDVQAKELGTIAKVTIDGVIQDLYPHVYEVEESPVGKVFLPPIDEGTTPERRDVSIRGMSPAAATIVSFQRDVTIQGHWILKGRTNKPFGTVSAKKKEQGNQWSIIRSTTADKNGRFNMTILSQEIPEVVQEWRLFAEANQLVPVLPAAPEANVGLMGLIEKVLKVFQSTVHAQTINEGVVMKPRLAYLDGIAYDTFGKPLPNTTVTVVSDRIGSVTYVTTTDTEGKYFVPSDKLPSGDYAIYYTMGNSSRAIKVDSTEFYRQNKDYLVMQNIDVSKPRYTEQTQVYLTQNPLPTESGKQGPSMDPKQGTPGQLNQGVAPTRAVEQNNPVNQLSPALLMYVAILLLLIVGAGLLIVYYMKRKQEPHLYE